MLMLLVSASNMVIIYVSLIQININVPTFRVFPFYSYENAAEMRGE